MAILLARAPPEEDSPDGQPSWWITRISAGQGRSRLRAASPDDVRHSRTYQTGRRRSSRPGDDSIRGQQSDRRPPNPGRTSTERQASQDLVATS